MKTRSQVEKDTAPNYQKEDGLQKKFIDGRIGYGVFATKVFRRGEFLLQYKGERVSVEEAERREKQYENQNQAHCYMYYYTIKGKTVCIDATHTKHSLGRLVNDDIPKNANSQMRKITHNGKVILCLFATKKIDPGQEIRYDYGVKNLPWRSKGNSSIKNKRCHGTIVQDIQPEISLTEEDTSLQPKAVQSVADNNCDTTVQEFDVDEIERQKDNDSTVKESASSEVGANKDGYPDSTMQEAEPKTAANKDSDSPMQKTTSETGGDKESDAIVEEFDKETRAKNGGDNTMQEAELETGSGKDSDSSMQKPDPETEGNGASDSTLQEAKPETLGDKDSGTTLQGFDPQIDIDRNSHITMQETEAQTGANKDSDAALQGCHPLIGASRDSDTTMQETEPEPEKDEDRDTCRHDMDGNDQEVQQHPVVSAIRSMLTEDKAKALAEHNEHGLEEELQKVLHILNLPPEEVVPESEDDQPVVDALPGVRKVAENRKLYKDILSDENSESNSSDNEADSEYYPSSEDYGANSDTDHDNPEICSQPVDIPSTSGTHCSRAGNLYSASTSTDKSGLHADSEDSEGEEDDTQNEEIHIKYSKRKKTANGEKRVYDKRNACLFCEKMIEVVIGRHYLSQHSSEVEVAQILAMPKNSRERKVKLDLLRNRGNFYHNEEVMQSKAGELILMRRPPSGFYCDPQDYGPCPQCLGFVAKNDLWRHARYRCIARAQHEHTQSEGKRSEIRMESDILMKQFQGASDKLKRTVLASMKRDDIFQVLSNDRLILEYGNQIFKNKRDRKHLVSQKMRAVAKIVLKLRENDPEGGQYISDFIKPSKFDDVVQAVEETCILIERQNEDEYQFPSKAINSGHDLVWIARIKRSQAIRRGDQKAEEESNRYLQLHQAEWHSKVSSAAAATLNARKCKKVVNLPNTSDLKKVSQHLESEIKGLVEKFHSDPQYRDYRLLQKITLARLIIFNKRRPAEMSKLQVSSVQNRPNWEGCQIDEVAQHLNPLEKQLSKNFQLIKIEGKRGRPVPVIVPPECVKALKVIINERESFGVPSSNPYVFARNTSSSFLDGAECISEVIGQLELEAPETLKCTKMRQYAATVAQVLSLDSREVEWLADHLGHDVATHKHYYRLQESTIELCKVSKLLLAMDRGEAANWYGRSLDDIDVEDIPVYDDDPGTSTKDIPSFEGDHGVSAEDIPVYDDDPGTSTKDIPAFEGDHGVSAEEKDVTENEEAGQDASSCNRQAESDVQEKCSTPQGKKFFRKQTQKIPWSQEERKCLYEFFRKTMKQGKVPGRPACREAYKKYPCLKRRNPDKIKDFVRNQIVKLAKKK